MTDRTTTHFRGRHYAAEHITGPLPFLNPTTRVFPLHKPQPPSAGGGGDENEEKARPKEEQPSSSEPVQAQATTTSSSSGSSSIYHIWRSRDNRKGRHHLILSRPGPTKEPPHASTTSTRPPPPTTLREGIARMFLRCPIWDISYDVAALFTLGSAVWVLNGFLVLLPLADPGASWPGEGTWGGGVSAAVGASVFEVGSVLLMLEAVNENRSDCFGWAVEEALQDGVAADPGRHCRHHHRNRRGLLAVGRKGVDSSEEAGEGDNATTAAAARRWTWWPSWYELRTHYVRDIGFLACLSQMIGATVFWISGFTGLPQVLGALSVPAEDGIYWLPQVIGGTGFIISSYLFMLETQPDWHTPSPRTLGWHIGLWNLIGALGFTLCGALGFAGGSSGACEAASLWATFIGSWAFLVGSIIQWYESLDKYPVTIVDINTVTAPGSA